MSQRSIIYRLYIVLLIVSSSTFLSAKSPGLSEVTLQLRWDHQFQFAGYYTALWNGYYENEGLKVTIKRALTQDKKILSATKEVTEGRADFGIGAADILIANDQGDHLTVCAVIFQQSAARYYIKKEQSFTSLADLLTLRVARRVNDLIDVELQSMLLSEGLDPTKVHPYKHQPGYDHFISDKVQVFPGYKTSTPYELNKLNIDFKEINPTSYGINFYGDSLFTSHKLVKKNPTLVERFVRASIMGWEYALENPDEIADKISDSFVRISPVHDVHSYNRFQSKIVKDLAIYPIIEVGHINPYRWQQMHSFQKKIKLIKGNIDLNTFIFTPSSLKDKKATTIIKFLRLISILILSVLIIIFIWAYSLKRMVNQKTQQIQIELANRKTIEKNLISAKSDIEKNLNEKETLLRELYHRTKNNMQVIHSMLSLQAINIEDASVKKLVKDTTNRIQTMAMVHEKLYQSKDLSNIDMKNYIIDLTKLIMHSYNTNEGNIEITFDINEITLLFDIAIPCGLLINELMSNTLKYAFPGNRKGKISIVLKKYDNEHLELIFSDNGIGVSNDFDFRHQTTLGLQTIFGISEQQLYGKAHFKNNNGLTCNIIFRTTLYKERV